MKIKSGYISYNYNRTNKECNFQSSFNNDDLEVTIDTYENFEGLGYKVKLIPKHQLEIKSFFLCMDAAINNESSVFLNGYQTWTNSREFSLEDRLYKLPKIMKPILNVYGDYNFYPHNKNKLQSFTYTYIRENDHIKLLGSLSEKTGYTIFEFDKLQKNLKVLKDCSGLIINAAYDAFDLYFIEGEENYCFNKYFEAMKLSKPKIKQCTGWTSWYNYYTNISEKIVLDNLNAFKSRNIPIDIFQIDDGYQEAVGDWLHINNKFPSGMGDLAGKIHEAGYKAGIWLAPFICEKRSRICREHPDWVLQTAGFNPGWSYFFNVLNFYNEEVRDYLRDVFHTVLQVWNYDMVKLDFLYAAALISRKDKTRGQIMYEAMVFLRELCKDKIFLGCGIPLGNAFGLTDCCRVGSDVSLTWEDKMLNFIHFRERVSTINSISSTIGRRQLNGRAFLNDPDVFIIRSTNNKLTKHQRYTLLLINLIFGGLVFTSDNINEYSEKELELYMSIFPIKEKVVSQVEFSDIVRIKFNIDKNEYLALCNLSNNYFITEIKDGSYFNNQKGIVNQNTKINLEPYESICFIKADDINEKYLKSTNIFML